MNHEIHNIALIIVGDEILDGRRLDRHTHFLGRAVKPFGLNNIRTVIVRDQRDAMVPAIRNACSDADIVFVTGGLGPTIDDITRECISEATGIPMHESPEAFALLEDRFRAIGRPITENNRRQAQVPDRGRFFENTNGTAPGLAFEHDSAIVIALPGPPRELEPMVNHQVIPYLQNRFSLRPIYHSAALHFTCLGESSIDQAVRECLGHHTDLKISLLARPGLCDLTLTLSGEEHTVQPRLAEMINTVRDRLAPWIYTHTDDSLEAVVLNHLRERGETIAVAESCTGGLIGSMLTEIPGSSATVQGGIIAYNNTVKQQQLGVPEDILTTHGAVSKACCSAMATGVCSALQTSWGISVTGIAGPDGGTPDKPVGTVWIGVATPDDRVHTFRSHIYGNRETIRIRSACYAIDQVRRLLEGHPPHTTQ